MMRLLNAICLVLLIGGSTPLIADQPAHLIPAPQQVRFASTEAPFVFQKKILRVTAPQNSNFEKHLEFFSNLIERRNMTLTRYQRNASNATIRIQIDNSFGPEQYRIKVTEADISITVSGLKSLSRATATMLQLICQAKNHSIPAQTIDDHPTSDYRNVMIDLGRNPHSLRCLYETIDFLWFYKVDSLHLHLTDDQRFAFPSKHFPKLQSDDRAKISWDEFVQLEQYAVTRGITLIPELEVPGHSTILRQKYPETFGKTTTDLASLPKARAGIKKLLDELIEVFPSSPWIHIGGDEAYGVPEDIQRDLINDLHQYLKSKGKQTLVWEGPSQGKGDNKVHPDVIHINWRTINFPADKMLAAGHRVVNAAWDPLYVVDHYPRTNFSMATPQYIYETLDLYRFAHFNPDIETFANPIRVPDRSNVIGFCMPWWEGREENWHTMMLPRIIPMADVAWNGTNRDLDQFELRQRALEVEREKYFCPIQIDTSLLHIPDDFVFHEKVDVSLSRHSCDEGNIRFTVDGSTPTANSQEYTSKIELNRTTKFRSAIFGSDGEQIGHELRRNFSFVDVAKVNPRNVAFGKPVTSSASSAAPFSIERITDGGVNPLNHYLGYPAMPKPIELTIDLGQPHEIDTVVVHAANNSGSWESYAVQTSLDGTNFETVVDRTEKPESPSVKAAHEFESRSARYVRILTSGNKDYVFDAFSRVTEVEVLEPKK